MMWTTRRQRRPLRAQRCRVPGMTIVRARSSLIPFGEPLDHSPEPERKVQCTTRRVKTLLLLSADTRSHLNRMPRRVRRPRRLLSKRTLQRRRDRPGSQKRFCIWKASQCMSRRTTSISRSKQPRQNLWHNCHALWAVLSCPKHQARSRFTVPLLRHQAVHQRSQRRVSTITPWR